MMIILPEWYTEADEEIEKVITKITVKNLIDGQFVSDSKQIEKGKQLILNSLLRIYDSVNVEQRKGQEEFMKEIMKSKKKRKGGVKRNG